MSALARTLPVLVTALPTYAPASITGAQRLSVRALDQFSLDIVPAPMASWSVSGGGTVSLGGLFTAVDAVGGPYTVTATSNGKTGSATVTLSAGSPPQVTFSANGTNVAKQATATLASGVWAPGTAMRCGRNRIREVDRT